MRKLLIILIALLISAPAFVFAQAQGKTFDLRQSPSADATIVAQLPMGTPIMPIIRKSGWVKVADPKTGNVGWVQSEKIEKSPVLITQVIASSGGYCKDNNCQFSFYSSGKPLTSKENDALWQRIHVQEQYILSQQALMQKQMNSFMNDLNMLMMRSTTVRSSDMAATPHHANVMFPLEEKQTPPKKAEKTPSWQFWKKSKS